MTIFFNGQPVPALAGDTVASALYRSGVRIFSRSFKYHRPRGLLCLAGRCPNCLMNVDGIPNVRTCVTPAREGIEVRHQNAYPSLEHDWLSVAERFSWLMPVGFYYKTFTHPKVWRLVEPVIRRIAGLGEIPSPESKLAIPAREYEHVHLRTDIAVIGGGPAGLLAAIEAANGGARVTLIDDQPELGGHLRYQSRNGDAGVEPARSLAAQVEALPGIDVLKNAACFGLYEGNLLGIVQQSAVAERLIHLRARQLVVATGAYETPLVFENNDLPGVMLSSGVERLVNAHGIKPCQSAVIVSEEREGGCVGADLQAAGVRVAEVVSPSAVLAATGRRHVTGISTTKGHIACDLIVVCGRRVPDAGLIAQAGGKLEWMEERGAFVPVQLPSHVTVVGDVTGASFGPYRSSRIGTKRSFVCFCEDVTAKDLCDAIAEGFDHIETLKRYTTVTMGPCQGKMCQLASIDICARRTDRRMGETGTTTARPPTSPVSLGSLGGARHHPVKRTPMHYKHDESGCVWMDMGEWKRPHRYANGSVEQEYRAVRERVGIIDVGTLGKLDVKGKDAPQLLDKVYANRLSDLRAGRVRYSVICDDAGIILDDGTISRISGDHFFLTTTTGNIEFVEQWLEWWAAGTGWCVHITNVTGGLASFNVAGPRARDVLRKLTDCDLSAQAFPYMACRQAEVGGAPCLMLRIGFVGETGWEIHFPAEYGEYLWDVFLEEGKEFGIQPFGVEAQRILRLEKKHIIVGVDTDATSNPLAADMAWVAKLDKEDFIGKAAILRIQARGLGEKLVGFVMKDSVVPDDGAAIVSSGKPVGRVTSVRFSPVNSKAVGLAWVPAELAGVGHEVHLHVDGRMVKAEIVPAPFYDPEGKRLRG